MPPEPEPEPEVVDDPAPDSRAPDPAAIVLAVCLVLLGVLVGLRVALDRPGDRSAAVGASHASPSASSPATYIVRAGDTLEAIAATLGATVGELRQWNDERYPGLLPVMALTPGIELATSGPAVPVTFATAAPTGVGSSRVPELSSLTFPARERVRMTFYEVTGWTASEISSSIGANGPWSSWLPGTSSAHVDVTVFYDFRYERIGFDCAVVATAAEPVHLVYEVVLPRWTPPANVADETLDWWTDMITDLAAHEAGHVQIYERYLAELNRTVREGSCATVEDELDALFGELDRANCEYDLAEYATAMGLSMESCLEAGEADPQA
jgi:predicted secreted Zn-dependent protease